MLRVKGRDLLVRHTKRGGRANLDIGITRLSVICI